MKITHSVQSTLGEIPPGEYKARVADTIIQAGKVTIVWEIIEGPYKGALFTLGGNRESKM